MLGSYLKYNFYAKKQENLFTPKAQTQDKNSWTPVISYIHAMNGIIITRFYTDDFKQDVSFLEQMNF